MRNSVTSTSSGPLPSPHPGGARDIDGGGGGIKISRLDVLLPHPSPYSPQAGAAYGVLNEARARAAASTW